MLKRLLIAVLLIHCAVFVFSQNKPRLGVLPFTGGTGTDGNTIANFFLHHTELLSVFDVVPRTLALNAIFNEKSFQLSLLVDPERVKSISNMLNAEYVLAYFGNT